MTKQFWKKVSANTAWKGFQLLSVFLLNIGIARVFKAGGSGQFLFLLANFQLGVTITSLSVDSGLQYYAAMDNTLIRGLSRFVCRYTLLLTAVLLPAGFLLGIVHMGMNPWLFTLYAVGFIIGSILFRFMSVLGYALRSFIFPTAIELGGNLVLLGSLFIAAGHEDLFFLLFYTMPLGCGLVVFFYLKRKYAEVFRQKQSAPLPLRALFRYSGMAFLNNLVFFGVYRIDYWFVHADCSAVELGNYIQAAKLGQLFFYFPQLISMVIFPDVVQGVSFTSRRAIWRLMASIAGIYTLFMTIFLLVGRPGLLWLLGPTFDLVYPAFIRLIPGIYTLGPLAIITTYFAATDKQLFNLKGALIGLAIMLAGDILFIPRYHIMGAALVSSAAYMGYFIYGFAAFYRQVPSSNA